MSKVTITFEDTDEENTLEMQIEGMGNVAVEDMTYAQAVAAITLKTMYEILEEEDD